MKDHLRVPLGLIGTVALIVVVEQLIALHEISFTTAVVSDWKWAIRSARREAPGCDILCFGDSLVKLGVQPLVLESRMGRRVYNLAVSGGQSPASYFLLRRALDAGARPKLIVVDFKLDLLSPGPEYNWRQWPELLTPAECLELAQAAQSSLLFTNTMVGRLFPSYKSRHDIRFDLMQALAGYDNPWPAEIRAYRRSWRLNHGAQLFLGKNFEDVKVGANDKFPPSKWKCNPVNAVFLARFLDLAAAHGIRVCWLLPPSSPGLQATLDRKGDTARLEAFMKSVQQRWPDLVILDARRAGYTKEYFVDHAHLCGDGAQVLSADLAEQLAQLMNEPEHPPTRWVSLPPLHQPGQVVPLESVEQSRLVVKRLEEESRRR